MNTNIIGIIGTLLLSAILWLAVLWKDIKNKPKAIFIVVFILSLLIAYFVVGDKLTIKYGFWGEINYMGLIITVLIGIVVYLLFKSRKKED